MSIVRKHDSILQKEDEQVLYEDKYSKKTDDNMHLLLRHMPHKESD